MYILYSIVDISLIPELPVACLLWSVPVLKPPLTCRSLRHFYASPLACPCLPSSCPIFLNLLSPCLYPYWPPSHSTNLSPWLSRSSILSTLLPVSLPVPLPASLPAFLSFFLSFSLLSPCLPLCLSPCPCSLSTRRCPEAEFLDVTETKALRPPCYLESPQITDLTLLFIPPPPIKSGLELVCNVKIV